MKNYLNNPLPEGVLYVKAPRLGMFPERKFLLWPNTFGLGYDVRDGDTNKKLGNIRTNDVKDNLETGFYILLDNSKGNSCKLKPI